VKRFHWIVLICLLSIAVIVGPAISFATSGKHTPVLQAVTMQAPEQRVFPETGHSVGGRFLEYWTEHGGLQQQGYPISEEMDETSDLDGSSYKVQYFERAVFEEHLENKAPYDVLLSQLGRFRYFAKYGDVGAPGQRANTGGQLFKETGHYLGGVFLKYWQEHGGLAQQGFPISEEFDEVSDLDGKSYTVQYFERAVFEMHPENPAPYNVLLSQLGTFRLKDKYPGGVRVATPIAGSTPAAGATPGTGDCKPVDEARKDVIGSTGAVWISNVQYAGQEYVEIRNKGGVSADLGGLVLRDKNDVDQAYSFAEGVVLAAGATIQVYTEPDHQYSFNSRSSIWNNCGDALELVNREDVVVSTYAYGTHLK
jgi:hypothetical protein